MTELRDAIAATINEMFCEEVPKAYELVEEVLAVLDDNTTEPYTDEIQYGKQYPDGGVYTFATLPRQWVDDTKVVGILSDLADSDETLVSRRVSAWEPVEGEPT